MEYLTESAFLAIGLILWPIIGTLYYLIKIRGRKSKKGVR